MFKIGDFARISLVSIKSLHYYDQMDVLKPAHVDRSTGYRYYTFEQLPRLHRILVLKDLGFSIAQIKQLLDDDVSAQQMRGMLKLRLSELQDSLLRTQEQFKRAETWLQVIEKEESMFQYEVLLKAVDPLTIASAREVVLSQEMMRERCIALMNSVYAYLREHKVRDSGLTLALYHNTGEPGIDVEMAVVVDASVQDQQAGTVQIYTLPEVATVASVIYEGSYDDFAAVANIYATLGKWIVDNGYAISGPARELYLRVPRLNSGDPAGTMEIQFPVQRATNAG